MLNWSKFQLKDSYIKLTCLKTFLSTTSSGIEKFAPLIVVSVYIKMGNCNINLSDCFGFLDS